jgi:Predicted membrane protein
MKWFFLLLAKLIVMGFWLGSIYFTFLHPLTGKIHTLIPVFAILVLMVHAIQAAIMTLVAKDLVKLSTRDYIELLLFGFFRMLELRGAIYDAAQKKKAEIEAKRSQH